MLLHAGISLESSLVGICGSHVMNRYGDILYKWANE